jgi:hypothetical protein
MKPRDVKRLHSTAQALGVVDLKSYAMGLLAEQLGLASAVRWTWALRDEQVLTPTVTNDLVIQRNFDPFTFKPSAFVNGHRWTYTVGTFPTVVTGGAGGTYRDAVEQALDQAGDAPFINSAVSAAQGEDLNDPGLRAGEYYSALSQDDIGGLRYMYTKLNVNPEVLPNGTRDVTAAVIRTVDTNTLAFVQGFDAFTFFTNALFLNPTQLTAIYTNLTILSTNVTLTNVVTTSFVLSNITANGLFTNTALPTVISNLDLFTFSEASRTNPPGALLALYPTLIITATNSSFEKVVSPVFFLTNAPYGNPLDPPVIATNFVTNILVNYSYQFANVITNYASAVTDLKLENIHRGAYGTPFEFTLETNTTVLRTNITSGGFYILDRGTNADLVGYTFYDANNVPLLRVTNVFETTNIVSFFTNLFDPTDVHILNLANDFTNVVYGAYPVLLNGTVAQEIVEVQTNNFVPVFQYTFDTNNLFLFPPANGNSNVVLQTITFTNGTVQITQSNVFTTIPKGTVLILDTNQFILAGPRIETFGLATNVLNTFTNPATGQFITQQLIYQTNSILFAVYPVITTQSTVPTSRAGVDTIQFVRVPYLDFLNQANAISTNDYSITTFTNGVMSTQSVRRIAGPDIVFSTFDQTTAGGFPVFVSRSITWQQGTTIIQGGATFNRGPGQVVPGSTIAFSTLSPSSISQTPGATTEENSILFLQWGSFDSTTLLPRLYPEDFTGQLQTLEDIVLRKNPAPSKP